MILTIFYTFIIISVISLIFAIFILHKYNIYKPIYVKKNNVNNDNVNNEIDNKEFDNKETKKQTNNTNYDYSEYKKIAKKLRKEQNKQKNNKKENNEKDTNNLENKCHALIREQDKITYKNADPNRKLYKGYEWQGNLIENIGNCNKQCNTCSVISSSLQPALWGTTLEEAEKTEIGSILPKFIYKKLDYDVST